MEKSARIVNINGRQWLAGMSWCSFEDSPSKDELREDARRLSSDWYAVRTAESVIQAGFCEPIEGMKRPRKLYSLAAFLADSREQPWLGIFKIDDGLWWYIAVRDHHAILPDGDVIGGEAEMHAARDRHSGYTDWKYIEGDIDLLAEFMDEVGEKPTPVKSLTSGNVSPVPIIASAAILLALVGGGYSWWHQKQIDEERDRAAAMARMREQLAANKAPVAAAPSPLLTTAAPNLWLAACGQVILKLPISSFGWILGQVTCDQTSVTVNWLRQDGATVAQKPDGVLSVEGDKIVQTIRLVGLDQKGADNATDLQNAQLVMRAWAQAANIPLTMSQNPTSPALPGSSANAAPGANVAPSLPQAIVKFDSPVSPFSLDFESIPGLRLTSIKSSANGWSVEGVLYATTTR